MKVKEIEWKLKHNIPNLDNTANAVLRKKNFNINYQKVSNQWPLIPTLKKTSKTNSE